MNTKVRLIAGVIVLIITLGGLYMIRYFNVIDPVTPPVEEGCTLEAKICPDGSAVGRTGPNCAFAACSVTTKKNVVVPAPSSVPKLTATSTPLPWKTYTNERFNFMVNYPATATLETSFEKMYHATEAWSQKGAVGEGNPVVSLSLPDITTIIDGKTVRLVAGGLRIGESADPKDVAACLSPDGSSEDLGEQTIGGEKVRGFIISSAGMSQFAVGKSYRLLREGVCLAFEPIVAGVTPGPLAQNEADYKRLSAFESAAVKQINQTLDAMMDTLRFGTTTPPVATTTPQV